MEEGEIVRRSVSSSSTEADPTEVALRALQLYYTPILVVLGSFGNCVSFCVFFCTKLRRSSSSIYLGALAVSDTGFLVSVFVVWLNMVEVRIFNQQGFCQFFVYLTTLCSFLSVWFVVAFTVERFVAVRYPLHRQSMCTAARARSIVASLTTLAIFLCSPVLLFSAARSDRATAEPTAGMAAEKVSNATTTECRLAEGWESSATIFNVIDTVLTFAIPFTIIALLNSLIARTIYRLAKVRRTLTLTDRTILPTGAESTQSQPLGHSSGHGGNFSQSPKTGLAQTKITKMLLIVSSAFLCFNLPAYVVRIHAFIHFQEEDEAPRSMVLVQQVCNLLFNTNFGINFILYCATGQNFRRALFHVFVKARLTRRRTDLTPTSNHGNQIASELTRGSGSANRHWSQRTIGLTEPWDDLHELRALSR